MPVVLIAALFSSCNKDDSEKASLITFEGKTYELSKGCISKPDLKSLSAPATNDYGVYLMSSGINMPYDEPPTGTGNFIGIWLYSSSATDLLPGTYEFADTYASFTFDDGVVFLETSYNPVKSLTPTGIAGGTLKVAVEGNTYEFTFNGTLEGGKSISAYYKGALTEITGSPQK